VIALAPASQSLAVVVKTQWVVPYQGNIALSSGSCVVVSGSLADPAILATDFVVVTGQGAAGGNYLKWTAVVDPGEVRFNVCNFKQMTLNAQAAMYLNGRNINILVLR